uniref:Uncharacterized protein n=1 Tax=Anopheles culicifacies TaxID=139723 RepID=A0A182MUT9_9DIPT
MEQLHKDTDYYLLRYLLYVTSVTSYRLPVYRSPFRRRPLDRCTLKKTDKSIWLWLQQWSTSRSARRPMMVVVVAQHNGTQKTSTPNVLVIPTDMPPDFSFPLLIITSNHQH